MKKLKNELFYKFTLPSILCFIFLYISIIVFFNYKYKYLVINRVKNNIPAIKKRIFLQINNIQNFLKYHRNHHMMNMRRYRKRPPGNFFPPNKWRRFGFIIYNSNKEIVFKMPKDLKKEDYKKINKSLIANEKNNLYLNIYINKKRLYDKKDKNFIKVFIIYSGIILFILSVIFFLI